MSDEEKDELGDYTKPLRERVRIETNDKSPFGWIQGTDERMKKQEIAELAEKLFVALSCAGLEQIKIDYCFSDAKRFIEAKDKFLKGEK